MNKVIKSLYIVELRNSSWSEINGKIISWNNKKSYKYKKKDVK